LSILYYPDGKKKLELNYKNGKLNGMSKEYFENGKLKAEWHYKEGVLN
jgi:antitoxin component YwqK of YwqJK toxin-antitoxin module